jgi:hypothetical protein
MYDGRIVFAQVMDFLPDYEFSKAVSRYGGEYKVKNYSCRDQFFCMAFAQLTYRESLRDIETCLRAAGPRLYHMGIRGHVARSNLARANENRDWRIYADLAQVLIGIARPLYADEDFGVDLEHAVYALDSTTIDLCLNIFPWARFRQHKGAVKLHTLMDLRGSIPTFIEITDGLVHDVNILDALVPEPGAYYIMDRGYLDFERLYRMDQAGAFFITRARDNFRFHRLYSGQVDKPQGIQCDQSVRLMSFYPAKAYPNLLRRIRYRDPETGKRLVFLTNQFTVTAPVITQLFRCRWQIEIFFKWIKQHLRIKAFYGTSANAVKTQVWIAVCVYLLVAIMKKKLHLPQSLYTILQVLSVTIFNKEPLAEVLTSANYKAKKVIDDNQLWLFKL